MEFLKTFNESREPKQTRLELRPDLDLLNPKMLPMQARRIIKRYNAAVERLSLDSYKRINEKTYDTKIVSNMKPEKLLQLIEYSKLVLKTNQHTK